MLQSVGLQRVGHDLATEQQSSLGASEASDGNIIVMNNLFYLFGTHAFLSISLRIVNCLVKHA